MAWMTFGGATADAVGNAITSAYATKQSYKYSLRLLKEQQRFAERMANTAHQREVDDLRAAGLNPILSATGGNGAASPVVSAPSVSVPTIPLGFGNAASKIAENSVAKEANKVLKQRADQENKQIDSNIAVAESQAVKNRAEAELANEQKKLIPAQIRNYDKRNFQEKIMDTASAIGRHVAGFFDGKSGSQSYLQHVGPSLSRGEKRHVPGFKNYPNRSVPIMEINKRSPGKYGGKTWEVKTTKGWRR